MHHSQSKFPRPSQQNTSPSPCTDSLAMSSSNTAIPPIIPAYSDSSSQDADLLHRKVVICLDGTGDEFDADNTNVVK